MDWGLHREGRCGEPLCIAVFNEEMGLELPFDIVKRNAYYDYQRTVYLPWTNNVAIHRWRFRLNGKCRNCEATGPTVLAGEQEVCIRWCLMTLLPWYPTGVPQPLLPDLMNHAKACIWHSSSQTSEVIAYLGSLAGSYNPLVKEIRSKSTFYLLPRKKPEESSSKTLSLNLDSLTPTLLNFGTQKNSN